MSTELGNAISAADMNSQYDEAAKRLIGNKIILAHILAKVIDEFHGMNPEEVVQYIEGDPHIGTIPIEPGLTNKVVENGGKRIVGFNTENAEVNEGLIRFDIIFYVRMKDGISQVIVNLEIQKDEPTKYDILNRAIFYVSRMISSQKERDFVNQNYDDIMPVFSIWLCLNMKEDSINHIHLVNDKLLGSRHWKGRLDLFNIIMVGVAKDYPKGKDRCELHRLLAALLSMEMPVNEKFEIMKNEYGLEISINDKIKEDISEMCNLSLGIMEKGMEMGMEKGMEMGRKLGMEIGMKEGEAKVIMGMYENNFTFEQIAMVTKKKEEEIKAIIEERTASA